MSSAFDSASLYKSQKTGSGWQSVKVLALVSLLFWVGVVVFVVREREAAKRDLFLQHVLAQQGQKRKLYEKASEGHNIDVVISETISHNPKVRIIHDFLSPEECELLIREGDGKLTPSMVVGKDGKNEANSARSSSGTFLMNHSPFISKIEERVARVSMLPVEFQEAFYLLRYSIGERYAVHPDYFSPDSAAAQQLLENSGGQRCMTMIVYLSEVEEGGGTRFPHGGIEVKAKRGQAVLWWDTHPVNGTGDPNSWHEGLPVIRGTKYVITKWIRVSKFGFPVSTDRPVVVH